MIKSRVKRLAAGKQYYKLHRIEARIRSKQYHRKHRKRLLAYKRLYYKKHRIKLLKTKKIYEKKNKHKILKRIWKQHKKRLLVDNNYRITCLLRHRLSMAVKNNQKVGSAVQDLGCTIEFFKTYIEQKFYGKMSWKNHGSIWQLDHIIPLKDFDLTSRKQLLKACNYRNLQPLTIQDHRKKTSNE